MSFDRQDKSTKKSTNDIFIYRNQHATDGLTFDYTVEEPLQMIYSEILFSNNPLKGDEKVVITLMNLDSRSTVKLRHHQLAIGLSDVAIEFNKRVLAPGNYRFTVEYHGDDGFSLIIKGERRTSFSNFSLWKKVLLLGYLLFVVMLSLYAILQVVWN